MREIKKRERKTYQSITNHFDHSTNQPNQPTFSPVGESNSRQSAVSGSVGGSGVFKTDDDAAFAVDDSGAHVEILRHHHLRADAEMESRRRLRGGERR